MTGKLVRYNPHANSGALAHAGVIGSQKGFLGRLFDSEARFAKRVGDVLGGLAQFGSNPTSFEIPLGGNVLLTGQRPACITLRSVRSDLLEYATPNGYGLGRRLTRDNRTGKFELYVGQLWTGTEIGNLFGAQEHFNRYLLSNVQAQELVFVDRRVRPNDWRVVWVSLGEHKDVLVQSSDLVYPGASAGPAQQAQLNVTLTSNVTVQNNFYAYPQPSRYGQGQHEARSEPQKPVLPAHNAPPRPAREADPADFDDDPSSAFVMPEQLALDLIIQKVPEIHLTATTAAIPIGKHGTTINVSGSMVKINREGNGNGKIWVDYKFNGSRNGCIEIPVASRETGVELVRRNRAIYYKFEVDNYLGGGLHRYAVVAVVFNPRNKEYGCYVFGAEGR
ncbi:hypothetical protein HY988_03445 [Candidatus Micrarchaeota archaeon]|nr:hypothetical protein [Candidatus Micrarchaeota archaeon]